MQEIIDYFTNIEVIVRNLTFFIGKRAFVILRGKRVRLVTTDTASPALKQTFLKLFDKILS